jgi:hypothetical protein
MEPAVEREKMRNAKCEMRNAKCETREMRNAKCDMRNAERGKFNLFNNNFSVTLDALCIYRATRVDFQHTRALPPLYSHLRLNALMPAGRVVRCDETDHAMTSSDTSRRSTSTVSLGRYSLSLSGLGVVHDFSPQKSQKPTGTTYQ